MKQYEEKNLIIGIVLLLFVAGIVLVCVFHKNEEKTDKKPTNNEGQGLQIQEDQKEVEEDSSDASGLWEEETSNEVTTKKDTVSKDQDDSDAEEDTTNVGEQQTGTGATEESTEGTGEDDEDTLIDDKVWGDIF